MKTYAEKEKKAPEVVREEKKENTTTPSRKRKRKLDDEKTISAPVFNTIEVGPKSGMIGQRQTPPPPYNDVGCCHVKKGMCLNHNIKASKNTIKSKSGEK